MAKPGPAKGAGAGKADDAVAKASSVDGKMAGYDSVDREIVRLKYENRGLSYEQIGKLLVPPISKQAVGKRIIDHGLAAVLDALESDVVAAYKSHQQVAVTVLAQTMNGTNTSWLRFQAALTFLQGVVGSKLALPDEPKVDDVVFTDDYAPPPKKLPGGKG